MGKGRYQIRYGMNNNPWRMGDLLSNPRWVGEVQQIIKMGHVLVKACKHKYLNGGVTTSISLETVGSLSKEPLSIRVRFTQ